jgi:murein DD-endopeptidase MepM/ murein hydrolase activator NlpD
MHVREQFPRFSKELRQFLNLSCIAGLVIIMTACQTSQPTSTAPPFSPTDSITQQVSAAATEPALPTTGITFITQAPPSPISSTTPIATITPDTLLFSNPTDGPVPISSWRPPLYPDPWAPTLYDHFYFSSPIAANEINTPVQDYRYGGVFFEDIVHTGVDIPAPEGTPILAAGPGTVLWADYGVFQGGYDLTDPYGLAVTIRHDFGYQNQALYTVYGHMDEVDVVEGQHVETGDLLGLVGETGKVTGPHLHFEVRIGENSFFTTRNPELWLIPPTGWGIIAGRMMDTSDRPIYDQQIIITNPQREENWFAWSYGKTAVNSDPYYQENLLIGSLPAGSYLLRSAFGGMNFSIPIEVRPGMVSYFTFRGYIGFSLEPPLAPGADFTPAPLGAAIP